MSCLQLLDAFYTSQNAFQNFGRKVCNLSRRVVLQESVTQHQVLPAAGILLAGENACSVRRAGTASALT